MQPLKTEVAFATPWFEVLAKTMQPGEAPYYSLRLPDYAAVVAITEDQRSDFNFRVADDPPSSQGKRYGVRENLAR